MLGLVGCGEPEKSPEVKAAAAFAISPNSKAGPSSVAMASWGATAMLNGEAEKGTSSIGPGQSMQGELSAADGKLDDGSYFDAFVFVVGEDSDVRLTLTSSAFDTYLLLYAGSPGSLGENLASNDDADGTNSGIEGSLPAGTYTAMANSYGAGATGAYTISLEVSGAGAGGGSTTLAAGRSVEGVLASSDETLDDGSHFQDWTLMGQAGDRVEITLRSSDFDAFLILRMDGETLTTDDDGAGGTDSSITYTLPSTGSYTVRANSYAAGGTGRYSLSVQSAGAPAPAAEFSTGGDPNGRYALLVGIDDYPGTSNDLRGPVEDARILERVLVERHGFDPANIVTLNDADATRANIARGIVQHLGQAGPDGMAVFFYSGHGMQIGENIGLTGALDPEPRGEGDEALYIYGPTRDASVLLDEELGYLIEAIDAGRKFFVVDACHSGEITRASGDAPQSKRVSIDDPEVADNLLLPKNFITSELKALDLGDLSPGFGDFARIADVFRNPQTHVMWGSSTEEQVSWTSGLGNGASVFTYYVGERMMQMPGSTTLGELHEAVAGDVVRYITNDGNMTMQNAQMRGPNQNVTLDDFFRQR